jgi:N-methylhydantoinase A
VEAAAGISEVVNHNMATATRIHIAERGRDPRNYAIVVFGGAGPVHGGRIAELLGIPRMICPLASGALSALGLLVAPTSFEFSHTYVARLDELDWQRLRRLFEDMEREGRQILSGLGIAPDEIRIVRSAEMRYTGQGFSVPVVLPEGPLDSKLQEAIQQAFYDAYCARYQQAPTNIPVQAINWRLTVSGPRPSVNLMLSERQRRSEGQSKRGVRPIYVPSTKSFVEAQVLDWYALENGDRFEGPAVVEARESTAIISPGSKVSVDPYMNLVVDLPTVESP